MLILFFAIPIVIVLMALAYLIYYIVKDSQAHKQALLHNAEGVDPNELCRHCPYTKCHYKNNRRVLKVRGAIFPGRAVRCEYEMDLLRKEVLHMKLP